MNPVEEREIAQKWYNDASFEGRTSNEFKALREELRKANTLDFTKYHNDGDYRRLIHENPLLQEFVGEETCITLWSIYGHRDEIGLSDAQFEKLLGILGEEVRNKFHEESEAGKTIKEMYRQFTPDEIARHRIELAGTLKKEIGLQKQNLPHTPPKISPFPEDRSPQK
ncbi:MAG: hypothetical protein M1378_03975 [Bacteroidetes bacterium]|nr:hypothetical protein [Bacteroidota bacterium]